MLSLASHRITRTVLRHFLAVVLAISLATGYAKPLLAQSNLSPGFAAGDASLTASQRAGREIWFFATAFNDRFYAYTYPQRLGGAVDWYKVLAANNKRDLFQAWGAIRILTAAFPVTRTVPRRVSTGRSASSGARAIRSFEVRRQDGVPRPGVRAARCTV